MLKALAVTLVVFLLIIPSIILPQPSDRSVNEVYRVPLDGQQGFELWIVDGATIRREIFPEFLYGGNGERYGFIPPKEIWIDNAITAEELDYTVAHELFERNLMAHSGISYDAAHDSALVIERHMRLSAQLEAIKHELAVGRVSPTDFEHVKEISELPDSITLKNIYRTQVGIRKGISIWVVDGATVRRDIYPDFGLSGNDLAYHFIPPKEIWIDGQISCEELGFSIAGELRERELMVAGTPYDDAYEQSLINVKELRKKAFETAKEKPAIRIPKILDRDKGTGKGL